MVGTRKVPMTRPIKTLNVMLSFPGQDSEQLKRPTQGHAKQLLHFTNFANTWQPLAMGLLSDRWSRDWTFSIDARRGARALDKHLIIRFSRGIAPLTPVHGLKKLKQQAQTTCHHMSSMLLFHWSPLNIYQRDPLCLRHSNGSRGLGLPRSTHDSSLKGMPN